MTHLAPLSPNAILLPNAANANQRKRLSPFIAWLDHLGEYWLAPDLAELIEVYRDHLLEGKGLAPQSVHAYLSSIRSRYHDLLAHPDTRKLLYAEYAALPAETRQHMTAKEYVDERVTNLEYAISPAVAKVTVTKKTDQQHIRLTANEAKALLDAPLSREQNRLKSLRDRALIATMLCTGVRAFEVVNIVRSDLYSHYEHYPALLVREGKGAKERRVVYGDLLWFRDDVEAWTRAADITSGHVFRGLKSNGKPRDDKMTTRAVEQILDEYPIMINGVETTVDPHDLRRTYARRLYEAGMLPEAIQAQLGHEDIRTTMRYIGDIDPERRMPKGNMYGR